MRFMKLMKNSKFYVTKTVLDCSKIPTGTYYTGKFDGKKVDGLIYNDKYNEQLIFHTNVEDLDDRDEVLIEGYDYAFAISYTDNIEKYCNVENLDFPIPPEGFIIPTIIPRIMDSTHLIIKGFVEIDGWNIPNNDLRELVKLLKD